MIARLRDLYRRLDLLQRTRGGRIALSIVALLAAVAIFLPVQQAGSRFAGQRTALMAAIDGQNVQRGDAAAIQLRDQGTVTVGGRSYGGEQIKELGELLFDGAGTVNAPARLVDLMLAGERPRWVPEFLLEQSGTTWLVGVVAIVWLQLIVWLGLTLPFLLVLCGTAAVAGPLSALDWRGAAVAAAGMGLLTFSFVLLVRLLLLILQPRIHALAVAHTLVKEAMRLNISLGFIVVLLVLLPLIPLWIDVEQPLRYQIQTFISRSLTLTYAAAACMTLLLSCATVAFEIRDRQIWQLMTKPMGRLSYLLGKFIGVAGLNLVLLAVCGISIFVFIQYLRTRPAADALDAASVRDEVLVARAVSRPVYQGIPRDELIKLIDDTIANDTMMRAEIESGQLNELDARKTLAVKFTQDFLARQRQVAPGQKKTFVFSGLDRARARGAPLTLRYLFYGGRSDAHELHPVLFEFKNLDRVIYRQYVPSQAHVLTVPSDVVDEQGNVELTIYNAGYAGEDQFYPGTITLFFDAKDFELLYKVSDFEWNFVRAVLVLWLKLAFLAMLGVCAATFLSFPVACILSFTVFIIGSMAPFLAESLEYFTIDSYYRIDQAFIMGIAGGAEWLMRSFGSLQPTERLVEGRLISSWDVMMTALNIGLIWCGVVLVVGWLAFRNKELAIYSGQG